MRIALIPCAPTEWQQEGRLLGRVELSPRPDAEDQCRQWAEQLAALSLKWIYHAPDELATRTAGWLARRLVVPARRIAGLAEVDLGLWAGLTEEQLKARYASAHRQLCEAPLNVQPPGGESLETAGARLSAFLRKQAKRNGDAALGLVLRPLSYALVCCALLEQNPATLWETAKRAAEPKVLEIPGGKLSPAAE